MTSPERTQIDYWLDELFRIEQDVRLHLEPLGDAQFNWRPDLRDGPSPSAGEGLESARGVALDQVKARSSAQGGGWIRFNLAAWFAASLAHGRRHVAQAEQITKAEGFPPADGR